jgi:hypothetical protein
VRDAKLGHGFEQSVQRYPHATPLALAYAEGFQTIDSRRYVGAYIKRCRRDMERGETIVTPTRGRLY